MYRRYMHLYMRMCIGIYKYIIPLEGFYMFICILVYILIYIYIYIERVGVGVCPAASISEVALGLKLAKSREASRLFARAPLKG